MMDTSIFWMVRGTYMERKASLAAASREWLEAAILDETYNRFLSSVADFAEGDGDGKRVPYIGWFWRHITFSQPTHIPIGDCGEFIGFMANNKWDHPERKLTADEANRVISIIDDAMQANNAGGCVDKIVAKRDAILRELWDYMQTLKIPR